MQHTPRATHPGAVRVLHLLAPAEIGGLERVVISLSAGQHRRGHDVRILVFLDEGTTDNPVVQEFAERGVSVDVVPLRARSYCRERAETRKLLAGFCPDIVHTHGARTDVLDAGVARGAGFATVTTLHGFTGGDWKNRLYETLQVRAAARAGAAVAVSHPIAEVLAHRGVSRERIHVILNAWDGGSPPVPRADARRKLGLDGTGTCIGWVGRLSREKGPDLLLEALSLLPGREGTLVIVGEGREGDALRTQASQLGVSDRIRWCGARDAAGRLMSAFDLFVLSSRTEGTPMVLFEAMAAEVPIVATQVGGVPDVVSATEAVLVPPHAARLAEGMGEALTDLAGARRRADAARERLDREFSVEPWLDRYDEVYLGLVGQATE